MANAPRVSWNIILWFRFEGEIAMGWATDQYPADWDQRRREVYERDDYTCGNCGRRGGPHGDAQLHAHHVVSVSKGGSHDLSNLTTVCHSCHETIHGHGIPTEDSSSATGSASSTSAAEPSGLFNLGIQHLDSHREGNRLQSVGGALDAARGRVPSDDHPEGIATIAESAGYAAFFAVFCWPVPVSVWYALAFGEPVLAHLSLGLIMTPLVWFVVGSPIFLWGLWAMSAAYVVVFAMLASVDALGSLAGLGNGDDSSASTPRAAVRRVPEDEEWNGERWRRRR